MRRQPPRSLAPLIGLALWLSPTSASAYPTLPPDFVAENAVPGTAFDTPTCIAFLPDGRLLVGEKAGKVWVVENGVRLPAPAWSGEQEVFNSFDQGLLGMAVHPQFATTRYVYFFFNADPDSDGVDTGDNSFGRLVRYRMTTADPNVVDPASRTVLIGRTWSEGPLTDFESHSGGCLRFGSDGSLLVSTGDGAAAGAVDPGGHDPTPFGPGLTDPYENIGAFRAQYLGSLCGKILRIDPVTGLGYPSNPYYNGDAASVQSRVWAYGVRNPFRFSVRPGTGASSPSAGDPGALYIGDVGWFDWEEIDILTSGGFNLGWPCYEGPHPQPDYQAAQPAHHGCSTMGTPQNPGVYAPPALAWSHDDSTTSIPAGLIGNCAMNGTFYTGVRYPLEYRGGYVFSDMGRNWVRVAQFDEAEQLVSIVSFGTQFDGPVDFALHPVSRDIHYAAIQTGEIVRIRYTGNTLNTPPVAVAEATPDSGSRPLAVQLSSAASSDADEDPLSFLWHFGDGMASTEANPLHVYAASGIYNAVLTVSDTAGAETRDTVQIHVTLPEFPRTDVLDSFDRWDGAIGGAWEIGAPGFTVADSALAVTGATPMAVWRTPTYGPDQEAFVTLSSIVSHNNETEYGVLLQAWGPMPNPNRVAVRYIPKRKRVVFTTYAVAGGWKTRGTLNNVLLQPGDRFGARLRASGTVTAYQNDVPLGSVLLTNWPSVGLGGKIGLMANNAVGGILDDFGGGTMPTGENTRPVAVIAEPAADATVCPDEPVHLSGLAIDSEDPPGLLEHHWRMDLHHNNHVHPAVFGSYALVDSCTVNDHDDGTGTYYELSLEVTDSGGLSDTARVTLYPEVNLRPVSLRTIPGTPGSTAPAQWLMSFANDGRMNARYARWRLIGADATIAEGDVRVFALDSAQVAVDVPPMLPPGDQEVRVVIDTLGVVFETDELDNGRLFPVTVVPGPGPDEIPPSFTLGPLADPMGADAWIHWNTSEVSGGMLTYGLSLAFTDSSWSPPDTSQSVLLSDLELGMRYYFQVRAVDAAGNTRVSPADSFTARSNPLHANAETPTTITVSAAHPNPTQGGAAVWLSLPREADVAFEVFDPGGRRLAHEPTVRYAAGRWRLAWDGLDPRRRPVRPGIYLARVTVDGVGWIRRLAVIR